MTISGVSLSFALLIMVGSSQAVPPNKASKFDPKIYPSGKFRFSKREFRHGEDTVQLIQLKNEGWAQDPHFCRAWLEVRKGNQLLKQLYFADMEAVGFSYGIFVPKKQPLPDYFIAVKEGDCDGRLLLVQKDGHLTNVPGGFYFLTENKRFLVGEYASDDDVLIVVDVRRRKVVIDGRQGRKISEVLNWYRDSTGYFFTKADEEERIYRLDLDHLTVASAPITTAHLAIAQKVSYDFDPRQKEDCTSAPQ